MKDRELPVAYARAVVGLAVAGWLRTLSTLRDNLRRDSSTSAALEDRGVAFESRKALADEVLPPDAGQEMRNFTYSLIAEGRLGLLDDILVELRRAAEHGLEVVVAEVTTAVPLGDVEQAALLGRLTARYGHDIDVTWRVEPSILGGVMVRVGDEVVDDSIATRLETLRSTLKGRG